MANWTVTGAYSGKECACGISLRTTLIGGADALVDWESYSFEKIRKGGNQLFSGGHLLVYSQQVLTSDPTYDYRACFFDPPVQNLARGLEVRRSVPADGQVREGGIGPTAKNANIVDFDFTIIPPSEPFVGEPAPAPGQTPVIKSVGLRKYGPVGYPVPHLDYGPFNAYRWGITLPRSGGGGIIVYIAEDIPANFPMEPPWDLLSIPP